MENTADGEGRGSEIVEDSPMDCDDDDAICNLHTAESVNNAAGVARSDGNETNGECWTSSTQSQLFHSDRESFSNSLDKEEKPWAVTETQEISHMEGGLTSSG